MARRGRPKQTGTEGYGLGFYVARYRGHRVLRHGGAMDGYLARFSFMPEKGLGLVVLSNLSGGNPVPRLVAYNLYDRLLGLEPLPWAERRREADRRRARLKKPEEPYASPEDAAPPGRPLSAYAGRYAHPAYGVITLEARDGALAGRFNDIGFALQHHDGETWRVPETFWPLREGLEMKFRADTAGRVEALATPIADGPTYRFNPGEMIFARTP